MRAAVWTIFASPPTRIEGAAGSKIFGWGFLRSCRTGHAANPHASLRPYAQVLPQEMSFFILWKRPET
jgi:hypothetical protein